MRVWPSSYISGIWADTHLVLGMDGMIIHQIQSGREWIYPSLNLCVVPTLIHDSSLISWFFEVEGFCFSISLFPFSYSYMVIIEASIAWNLFMCAREDPSADLPAFCPWLHSHQWESNTILEVPRAYLCCRPVWKVFSPWVLAIFWV